MIKPTPTQVRSAVAVMVLAASTIVSIATHEGYSDKAYIPVPGDVPTIDFGRTNGVKMGDKSNPVRGLQLLLDEVDSVYAQGVRNCVTVPLYQYEFAAYVSLAYNIGVGAFCKKADKDRLDKHGNPYPESDRLIDVLNKGDYAEACRRIDSFNKSHGKVLPGLVKRRAEERAVCEGRA